MSWLLTGVPSMVIPSGMKVGGVPSSRTVHFLAVGMPWKLPLRPPMVSVTLSAVRCWVKVVMAQASPL